MANGYSIYLPPIEVLTLSDDDATTVATDSVQIFDIATAKEWFHVIEDGVPEDVALKLLEEEATAAEAPPQYEGCLNESGDGFTFTGLTEAETKVIGMYCTESYQFYRRLNADCRNRIWKKYRVYTSLLHSVCMKLRNMPFEREEFLYRGLYCNLSTHAKDDFCWPCFTSATTQRSIAEAFGHTIVRLKSETGAPVKQFSSYFEYEVLFSPFHVFKSQIKERSQIYCSMPEESGFFLSFPYYRGSLLGAVVGNCLGSPFEFVETSTLETLIAYFNDLGKGNQDVHCFTSDTCMTQALAISLIENKGLDIKNLSARFVKEYVTDPMRNYGQSVVTILAELTKQSGSADPYAPAQKQFGGSGSHGNGGAMRISPAALYFYKLEHPEFNEMVRKITRLTHSNIAGVNGAILQANAVKLALKFALAGTWQKDIRNEFLDELIRIMKRVEFASGSGSNPYCEKLTTVKEYLSSPPTLETIRKELGNAMPAIEAVPAAIYSFVRGLQPIHEIPDDYNGFKRTILYAISLGGDTDTIASMAGAIAGAYYGQDSIPQKWRDVCEAKGINSAKRYSKEIHNLVWQ